MILDVLSSLLLNYGVYSLSGTVNSLLNAFLSTFYSWTQQNRHNYTHSKPISFSIRTRCFHSIAPAPCGPKPTEFGVLRDWTFSVSVLAEFLQFTCKANKFTLDAVAFLVLHIIGPLNGSEKPVRFVSWDSSSAFGLVSPSSSGKLKECNSLKT